MLNALKKHQNICIRESNQPQHIPLILEMDQLYIINNQIRYAGLDDDHPQVDAMESTDLIHAGEHFDKVDKTYCEHIANRTVGLYFHGHHYLI